MDGARRRRGQAIALIITAAALCLVGGVAGVGGLVVLGQRAIIDEARDVVTRYVTAVQHTNYSSAYALLCRQQRLQITESEFVHTFEGQPSVLGFTVGDPVISSNQTVIDVPVVLRTTATPSRSQHYQVTQDESTAEFRVCGVTG
jgi:hypothetical protein